MTVDQGKGPAGALTGIRAARPPGPSPKQGREAGMVPTGGHGSGRGKRAWPYCAATLYALLVPATVRAMDGFRPGLWAITTTFSGAMALTSHGDDCLRRIGPVATTTSDINKTQGLHGPVSVQVRRRPGTTIVTWSDRLQMGPALTVDHGQGRFTRRGPDLIYRGTWTRTQWVAGQPSVIHAILHGHWLGAQCPKAVVPGTLSSPTLAKLNALAAKLAVIMHGEKAEMAAEQAALARANALTAHQKARLAGFLAHAPHAVPSVSPQPQVVAPVRPAPHPVAVAAPKPRPRELFRHPPGTPQGQAALRRAWAQLRASAAVRQGPLGKPVAMQIVFDPDEPFCHALWVEMQAFANSPVVIRWVPVALVRASTLGKAAAIVTAGDPLKALAYDERHFNVHLWAGGIRPLARVSPALRQTIIDNTHLVVRLVSYIPFMIYRQNGHMRFLGGVPKKAVLTPLLSALARQKGP